MLVLDGGGIKGIAILSFLNQYQTQQSYMVQNKKIAGVSIGSILAIGLLKGFTTQFLMKLIQQNASKIFSSSAFGKKYAIITQGYYYENQPMKNLLNKLISKAQYLSTIPSQNQFYTIACRVTQNKIIGYLFTNINNQVYQIIPTPSGFKFKENKEYKYFSLIDIIMASCAAVPYFPPYIIKGQYWVDGGILYNNPTFIINQFRNQYNLSSVQFNNIGFLDQVYEIDNVQKWFDDSQIRLQKYINFINNNSMANILLLSKSIDDIILTIDQNLWVMNYLMKKKNISKNTLKLDIQLDDVKSIQKCVQVGQKSAKIIKPYISELNKFIDQISSIQMTIYNKQIIDYAYLDTKYLSLKKQIQKNNSKLTFQEEKNVLSLINYTKLYMSQKQKRFSTLVGYITSIKNQYQQYLLQIQKQTQFPRFQNTKKNFEDFMYDSNRKIKEKCNQLNNYLREKVGQAYDLIEQYNNDICNQLHPISLTYFSRIQQYQRNFQKQNDRLKKLKKQIQKSVTPPIKQKQRKKISLNQQDIQHNLLMLRADNQIRARKKEKKFQQIKKQEKLQFQVTEDFSIQKNNFKGSSKRSFKNTNKNTYKQYSFEWEKLKKEQNQFSVKQNQNKRKNYQNFYKRQIDNKQINKQFSERLPQKRVKIAKNQRNINNDIKNNNNNNNNNMSQVPPQPQKQQPQQPEQPLQQQQQQQQQKQKAQSQFLSMDNDEVEKLYQQNGGKTIFKFDATELGEIKQQYMQAYQEGISKVTVIQSPQIVFPLSSYPNDWLQPLLLRTQKTAYIINKGRRCLMVVKIPYMLNQKQWVARNIQRDRSLGVEKANYPLAANLILLDFQLDYMLNRRPIIIVKHQIQNSYVRTWIGVNEKKLLSIFSSYYSKTYPADQVIIGNALIQGQYYIGIAGEKINSGITYEIYDSWNKSQIIQQQLKRHQKPLINVEDFTEIENFKDNNEPMLIGSMNYSANLVKFLQMMHQEKGIITMRLAKYYGYKNKLKSKNLTSVIPPSKKVKWGQFSKFAVQKQQQIDDTIEVINFVLKQAYLSYQKTVRKFYQLESFAGIQASTRKLGFQSFEDLKKWTISPVNYYSKRKIGHISAIRDFVQKYIAVHKYYIIQEKLYQIAHLKFQDMIQYQGQWVIPLEFKDKFLIIENNKKSHAVLYEGKLIKRYDMLSIKTQIKRKIQAMVIMFLQQKKIAIDDPNIKKLIYDGITKILQK